MSNGAATSLRRRALLRQAPRHVPARASPFRLRCCTELVTRLGGGLVMAHLRRKRIVRFLARELRSVSGQVGEKSHLVRTFIKAAADGAARAEGGITGFLGLGQQDGVMVGGDDPMVRGGPGYRSACLTSDRGQRYSQPLAKEGEAGFVMAMKRMPCGHGLGPSWRGSSSRRCSSWGWVARWLRRPNEDGDRLIADR